MSQRKKKEWHDKQNAWTQETNGNGQISCNFLSINKISLYICMSLHNLAQAERRGTTFIAGVRTVFLLLLSSLAHSAKSPSRQLTLFLLYSPKSTIQLGKTFEAVPLGPTASWDWEDSMLSINWCKSPEGPPEI